MLNEGNGKLFGVTVTSLSVEDEYPFGSHWPRRSSDCFGTRKIKVARANSNQYSTSYVDLVEKETWQVYVLLVYVVHLNLITHVSVNWPILLKKISLIKNGNSVFSLTKKGKKIINVRVISFMRKL